LSKNKLAIIGIDGNECSGKQPKQFNWWVWEIKRKNFINAMTMVNWV